MSLSIYWCLQGDRKTASSRIHGYRVHEYLRRKKIDSHLLLAPPFKILDLPWKEEELPIIGMVAANNIVIFQKLEGTKAKTLVEHLRTQGTKTVYIQCDYRPSYEVPKLCDVIVCPSSNLADYYRQTSAATVIRIPDAVEYSIELSEVDSKHVEKNRLRICWIGIQNHWSTLKTLRSVLSEAEFSSFSLSTISDHLDADIAWHLNTVESYIKECDIAVIPTGNTIEDQFKSNNRVTLFMALGLPVIAGRIPAYEEIIENGKTGYLVESADEIRCALRALKSVEKRREIASRAYIQTRAHYSLEVIGQQWLALFEQLGQSIKRDASESELSRPLRAMYLKKTNVRAWLRLTQMAVAQKDWETAVKYLSLSMLWFPLNTDVGRQYWDITLLVGKGMWVKVKKLLRSSTVVP